MSTNILSIDPRMQTLYSPNVQFEIHQMVLNPSGKLLAVAGAFEVAVVVLPRAGFMRLLPETIDSKYALILLVTYPNSFT